MSRLDQALFWSADACSSVAQASLRTPQRFNEAVTGMSISADGGNYIRLNVWKGSFSAGALVIMKKEVQNWLDSARYDLETARHLFQAGIYIHTVFMCHLALEKALKARVEEIAGEEPPKTHDLEYLMKLAGLSPSEDMEDFILELSNLSVVTRYPRDFHRMLKDFSRDRVELTLSKATEAFQWIQKTILP